MSEPTTTKPSAPEPPKKIEIVGPAGRIKIRESDLGFYREKGYVTLEEHLQRAAAPQED